MGCPPFGTTTGFYACRPRPGAIEVDITAAGEWLIHTRVWATPTAVWLIHTKV
jgi:hypothetical protein